MRKHRVIETAECSKSPTRHVLLSGMRTYTLYPRAEARLSGGAGGGCLCRIRHRDLGAVLCAGRAVRPRPPLWRTTRASSRCVRVCVAIASLRGALRHAAQRRPTSHEMLTARQSLAVGTGIGISAWWLCPNNNVAVRASSDQLAPPQFPWSHAAFWQSFDHAGYAERPAPLVLSAAASAAATRSSLRSAPPATASRASLIAISSACA